MNRVICLLAAALAGLVPPAGRAESPAPSVPVAPPAQTPPPSPIPIAPAQPVPVAPALPAGSPTHAVTPSPSPSPAPAPAPTAKPSPTPSQRQLIEGLNEQQVEQAIQMLRSSFFDNAKLDDKELRRSALEGLLDRLGPGASLQQDAPPQPAPGTGEFVSEILDARTGYLRPGAIDKGSLAQLDAALKFFGERKLGSVILDLRAVPPSGDFELSAEFARRFCPKGQMLFSVVKPSAKQERTLTSNQDPAFEGVLIVLTDRDTAGAAEVLAAALRQTAKAMIVGDQTAGEAVEFATLSLGGGKSLRVAVAQVILPGAGPIYPAGVKPDISASLPQRQQEEIFRLSREKGISQFVFEGDRPRMNEAALVSNTNPEIDGSGASKSRQPQLWDTVLQRAVDLVTAISFYNPKR